MLYNVQALRAFAAYLVVVIHLEVLLGAAGVSSSILWFGDSGVDLFFVISGFVMVYTTARRSVTPQGFLLNRIVRIVPMYWLLTLAVFMIALAKPELLGATRGAPIDLVKSLLFIPFAKTNGLIQPVLFLGWTLNYEMFFYLIFALALLVRGTVRSVIVASVPMILLVVLGQIFHPQTVLPGFYTQPIIIEFVFGMWLGLALLRDWTLPRGVALAVLVLGLVVLIGRYAVVPGGQRAWWSGCASLLIVAGALSLEREGLVLRNRLVQLIGAASYALYLIHPFVTQAATKVAIRFGLQHSVAMLCMAVILIFAIVGLAAVVLHWTVERPMSAFFRRLTARPPSVVDRAEDALVTAPAGHSGH